MRRRGRMVWLAVGALLALFVAFEVGVRLVTPDAVEYHIQSGGPLSPATTQSGTITDTATLARLRELLAEPHPTSQLRDAYFAKWSGHGCSVGSWTTVTLRFTWHGLPVEVVSPGPGCAFEWSEVSRGGLPDPTLTFIDASDWRLP